MIITIEIPADRGQVFAPEVADGLTGSDTMVRTPDGLLPARVVMAKVSAAGFALVLTLDVEGLSVASDAAFYSIAT